MKAALEPVEIALTAFGYLEFVGEDGGKGVHRRIDIAKVPFVGGKLSAGVNIGDREHQVQLLLTKVFVYQCHGNDMKGQVPGRIPGVFPLVRHRDDVGVVHVLPMLIALA